MLIPPCHRVAPTGWWPLWRTRLTRPNFPRMDARSWPVTPCCNRASQPSRPARTVRAFRKSIPGMPGSTCTPLQSRMYTRICLAKAVTSEKGSMMWRPSNAAWQGRCARIPCSAMTCSKGFMDGRRWSRISYYMKNTRGATWDMPNACAVGSAAIGSYCPGCSHTSAPKAGLPATD